MSKTAVHGHVTHGACALKRAVMALGSRAIDRRTSTGKALAQWRAELIQDLGGPDALSAQQATLIDLCVKDKLLLDSLDSWMLQQKTLVNARKKSAIPVLLQRGQLADGLARRLGQLGLERKARPAKSLADVLAGPGNDDQAAA